MHIPRDQRMGLSRQRDGGSSLAVAPCVDHLTCVRLVHTAAELPLQACSCAAV